MQSTKKLSMYFKSLLFILSLAVFFQACSSKKITVYNQSASYWYNEMIASINQGDLDAADDTYTSLNSEHRNSPLIPTSLVILANAHVEDEEYELANYYLDEYLKRFAQSKNVDYVRYFKIKSKFLAFNSEFRNQKLVSEILDEIQAQIFFPVYDPKGIQGDINTLTIDERDKISTRAFVDSVKASQARDAEKAGHTKSCFSKWQEIFGSEFPKYE